MKEKIEVELDSEIVQLAQQAASEKNQTLEQFVQNCVDRACQELT